MVGGIPTIHEVVMMPNPAKTRPAVLDPAADQGPLGQTASDSADGSAQPPEPARSTGGAHPYRWALALGGVTIAVLGGVAAQQFTTGSDGPGPTTAAPAAPPVVAAPTLADCRIRPDACVAAEQQIPVALAAGIAPSVAATGFASIPSWLAECRLGRPDACLSLQHLVALAAGTPSPGR
jgi:hypothetical protein